MMNVEQLSLLSEEDRDVSEQSPAESASPHQPFPFRSRPREASREEIERANQREDLSGVRRYGDPEEEIRRIQGAKSAVLDRRLSWIEHPDERVAIEALREKDDLRDHLNRMKNEERDEYYDAIFRRIRHLTLEEGVIWSPIHDAMATHHGDGKSHAHWKELSQEMTGSDPNADSLPQAYGDYLYQGLGQYLGATLVPWVEKERDPERIVQLVRSFGAHQFQNVLCQNARCLDVPSVEKILAIEGDLGFRLCKNQHLSPEVASQLATHALEEVRTARRPEPPRNRWSAWRTPPPAATSTGNGPRGGRMLRDLLSRYPDQLSEERAETMRRILAKEEGEPHSTLPLVEAITTRSFPAPESLLTQAYEVFAEGGVPDHHLRNIIHHPNAGTELWRRIAKSTGAFKARRELANHSEARRDPVVYQSISKSTSWSVQAHLFSVMDPEEFKRSFEQLVRQDTEKAVHVLQMRDEIESFHALDPGMLAPILASDSKQAREIALGALGDLEGEAPKPEELGAHRKGPTPQP